MKIRTWYYGTNSYVDFQIGDVHCIERPLWVHIGNWFVFSVLGRGCCLLHWLELPKSIKTVQDGVEYSMREYYGDVGSVYHTLVFSPVFQWWYDIEKNHQKEWVVSVGYEKLREIFGEYDKSLEPVWRD